MMELHYQGNTHVPVEVEGITPDALRGKSASEVSQLPIFHGNQKVELGEFFRVEGDSGDDQLHWHGDLRGVHWIGAKMNGGTIHVHGDCGRHVGSEMKAGRITVDGNASDWVGGELHGGEIEVKGDAGHLVGAAYRGSARGMTGGSILVHGKAGNEVGHTLRRGTIVVGAAADLAAFNMLAGTILICGDNGIRHGAGMRRGSLLFAGERPTLLPTFRYACAFDPPFVNLLLRHLRSRSYPLPDSLADPHWDLYHGDMIEGGRGEVLMLR